MELYQAIMARRSVRSYEDHPIPREILGRLLEAAREAPSANNRMPWKLVLISDADDKASIAASGPYARFAAQAPVILAACGDERSAPSWYAVDTSIALEHVALAAAGEGLGSCWIGSFDEDLVRRILGLPDGFRVVALLSLGYPRERVDLTRLAAHLVHPTKRIQDLASEGRFSEPWKA